MICKFSGSGSWTNIQFHNINIKTSGTQFDLEGQGLRIKGSISSWLPHVLFSINRLYLTGWKNEPNFLSYAKVIIFQFSAYSCKVHNDIPNESSARLPTACLCNRLICKMNVILILVSLCLSFFQVTATTII